MHNKYKSHHCWWSAGKTTSLCGETPPLSPLERPSVTKTSSSLLSRPETGPLLGFPPVERHQWEEPVPAKSWQILDHSGDGVARSQEDESGIMCRIGREVLTESWMASSLHYYGQCGFAYEGNKHASVSGSHLRLILTSVSWNYLLSFIKSRDASQSPYFYDAILENLQVFEIKSGQNGHAGWCHCPAFASVCFLKWRERSPVIRKGQCFHFNIADVSQFKCHHVCSRWPLTHTKAMTQHSVQPTDNSRCPRSVFCYFFFLVFF